MDKLTYLLGGDLVGANKPGGRTDFDSTSTYFNVKTGQPNEQCDALIYYKDNGLEENGIPIGV